MEKELLEEYNLKKNLIKSRLKGFQNLPPKEHFKEFIFCMLTPQSNAQKCWQAVEQLSEYSKLNRENIVDILKSKTRFHNNKSLYVMQAEETWKGIYQLLENPNRILLRNIIAAKVKGYGLKEASHFLRNIGKSDNQIAILDRHILKNLKILGIIETDKIKSRKHYLELEQKFLQYSKKIGIPIDELDLLFWSRENGEIFK